MKKFIFLMLAVLAASHTVTAQLDLTLYNARYLHQSGFANASFFPECKVNVGGIVFGSTYFRYGNNGLSRKSLSDFSGGTDQVVKALDRMKELNHLDLEFRKDIIHFGFQLKEKNYVGLNISARSHTVISYPRDFATLIFLGNGVSADDPDVSDIPDEYQLLGKRANFDGTGADHMTFGEIGIRYARKLLPDDQLTVGIRPKLLLGFVSLFTEESTLGMTTDANTFGITLDGSYSYSTSVPWDSNGLRSDYGYFDNLGFGVDLGASYNITEKFQVSASVNDLGYIKWKYDAKTYSAENGSVTYNGIPLDGSILNIGNSFDSLGSDFAEQMGDSLNSQFGADTTEGDYRTWLTTRYNIGVNYQFSEKQNVGLLINAHTVKKKLRAAMTLSYNLRVRKWFGFHANYSIYNNSFLNVGLGLSFNIFPWQFYAMTDNVLAFLPSSRNSHVRAGINWTFGCKPNDRDKDGIPNKDDACPDKAGPVEHKGCPDTDGDGIIDKDDECPTEKGPKESNGCPDRDGDGILDKNDECPDAPGIEAFNGCPDTDEDGIRDSEDECPTVAGIEQFNGCPDTDSDGIRDSEDDCPEKAGTPEFNGCPDTDGDGIMDNEDDCPEKPGDAAFQGCPDTDGDGLADNQDACPEKAGPVDNNGCPFGDRDGDGVIDKEDSCPDAFGPAENAGCPYSDLDGDGVIDKDDRCPQTPGPADNAGCPKIEKEEQEVLNTAFDNLEFETGRDVIKQSSYESLDRLAELLIKKESWKLQIAGHTDNVGSESANMKLSEQRAKAVATYLESKGVQRDRMIVQWFGESKPIADNSTPEGRQTNRRVEMEIVFD